MRYIIVLISLCGLASLRLMACGGEYIPARDAHYNIIEPELFRPTYPDMPDSLFTYQYKNYSIIDDWYRYIDAYGVTTGDISDLILSRDLGQWELMDAYVRGQLDQLPDTITGNNFLAFLKQEQCLEITELVVFLKKAEPIVTYGGHRYYYGYYNWADRQDEAEEQQLILALLEEGKKRYAEEDDRFLKMRYAHQLVRLARFAEKYDEAIELYQSTYNDLPGDHVIEHWMTMQYAGALAKTGNRGLANYLFLKEMYLGGPKASEAELSIKIRSYEDWVDVLSYCKHPWEQEWVYKYFDSEVRTSADERLKILRQVLRQNPNSLYAQYLAVTLARETEIDMLPVKKEISSNVWMYYDEENPEHLSQTTVENLSQLAAKQAVQVEPAHKGFWYFVAGYAAFINNHHQQAATHISNALKQKQLSPSIKNYALLIQKYIAVATLKHIDARAETALLPDLQWVERNFKGDQADYMYQLLAQKYFDQNDTLKGLIASCKEACYEIDDEYYLNLNMPFKEIWAFRNKKDKSSYEEWLISPETINRTDGELLEAELMSLMGHFKFKEAAKLASEHTVANSNRHAFPDPFILYPNNQVYQMRNWDGYPPEHQQYNRKSFAIAMGALVDSIEAHPQNNARFYLQLAKGMAHMKSGGAAWLSTSYYDNWYRHVMGSDAFNGSEWVLEHFQKVIDNTNNRELQAEALVGMIWYLQLHSGQRDRVKSLVKQLYYNFEDTQYYQEIIKECGYACYANY